MRYLNFIFAVFIISSITFAWPIPKGNTQDYYTQEDPNKKIIKNAILGAGVGAVASGTSGGDAGKGALIGAGTNVIGSALIDSLTSSPQPQYVQQTQYVQQPRYVQQAPPQVQYTQRTVETIYPVDMETTRRGGCSSSR